MNDFNKAIIEFNNYTKNFSFENKDVKMKYKHTFRVVDYAKDIAISENLNEHDQYLAFLCALLHDIARFKQTTEYGTFNDLLSFDHGDMGYEILIKDDYISKFVNEDEDKKIILKAVKNHNKFDIEEGLTKKELFFAKLVRDADKIDIMDMQGNNINDNNFIVEDELFNAVLNENLVLISNKAKSDIRRIFVTLCFIFDINFKRSFEIIREKKIIERKLNALEGYIEIGKMNIIKNKIFDFLKKWY